MKLAGKVALITGTSPNIGGGIAEGLAAAGAKVSCLDLNEGYANGCAAGIVARGGEAIGIVCSVTDEAQVAAAVARTVDHFGGIDILVNGAVMYHRQGVLDMPVSVWEKQLSVILTGAFLVTQQVARRMVEGRRRGSIINIVSTAGHQGEPWNVGYCTAKSGLLNFTRSVAMELGEHGIRVNSLTPTATDRVEGNDRAARWGVGMTKGAPAVAEDGTVRPGFLADSRSGSPLHRLPSPYHYAQAAVFLASDDAEMITGSELQVDAGTLSRYWRWSP